MARKKISKGTYTKQTGFEAVANSLREFGYPDCTAAMVCDTYEAMKRGDTEMPHGIVGMFAQRQLEEVREKFDSLPDDDTPPPSRRNGGT